MKKLSLILIALCTCATFFCERDTNPENEWPRDVEPRLSNASSYAACHPASTEMGKVVQQTRCAAAVTHKTRPCWDIVTADHARDALSHRPNCLDKAIAVLRERAEQDANAINDLAAGLFVRAQRGDNPEEFLEALSQTRLAIQANPASLAARFNHALVLETLGADEEAIRAWTQFIAIGDGRWRDEAIRRRDELRSRVSGTQRWQRAQQALTASLRRRDLHAIQQLIEPFPSPAHRYFEEVLLLRWAESPTAENFEELTLFATALSQRLQNDPFPLHAVDAIRRAKTNPSRWSALRSAHRAYAHLRTGQYSGDDYNQAAQKFASAGSPFALLSRIRAREPLAEEAAARDYCYLAAASHWTYAADIQQSRFVEALAEYERARVLFAALKDYEGLVAMHSRKSGVYRILGDRRSAWREAFYAQRHLARVASPKHHTGHLFEIALAAAQWQQPALALSYLTTHTEMLQNATPIDLTLLPTALRHRARAALDVGDIALASRDIEQLSTLPGPDDVDQEVHQWLEAREAELKAQQLLKQGDAQSAIPQFTIALANTNKRFTTLQASQYAQRAEAYERAGQASAARADLTMAVSILQREAESQLAQRPAGLKETADEFWRTYFDRSQRVYRDLIRMHMDGSDSAAAFDYAEMARAAEPLSHVDGNHRSLREVLASLPPQTYILEYCVLDNESYYWLIGNGRYRVRHSVPRSRLERWRNQLHDAVTNGRTSEMDVVLTAMHQELVAPALAHVPRGARIVIVPDGPLYAFPFAAMSDGREYLIERNILEYSGSSSLYFHSLRRDQSIPLSENPSVLAVGNPAFSKALPFASELPTLSHASGEARSICALYTCSDPLLEEEATVPEFLKLAPDRAVIHVAAHAIVNADEPLHSAILFAPSKGDDGLFEAHELAQVQLPKTRMVVLAACESGGGVPIGSESVAPLVRPLIGAGVPAVVASLWNVYDVATTPRLLVSFHMKYRNGQDAATALRDAQLEAIQDKQSVRDWAAFQVIGHATSPFAPRPPDPGGTKIGVHSTDSLQRSDRLRSQ